MSRWRSLFLIFLCSPLPSSLHAEEFEAPVVTVRGRRLPPQVSEHTLTGAEARRLPGAAGDVMRAVATLPGAVTANDYLANLLVRGGGVDDNLILLDGFPVAYPFHFGGLEGVFHPGLIDEALFLPGAFDVRFGDTLGGVLSLSTRPPAEGLHGELGLSAIQAGALLSRSSEGGAWTGSYRRGYFDLIFPGGLNDVGLPSYQDAHAQWRGALVGGQARLLVFGSQDFLSTRSSGSSRTWDSAFATAGAAWERRLGVWRVEAKAAASEARMALDLGPDLRLERRPYEWLGALQADAYLEGGHAVNGGLQWHQTRTILDGTFARVPVELGTGIAFNDLTRSSVNALGSKAVSSAWAQDRWQFMPSAAMTLGARLDQVDISSEWHASPRWALEWQTWKDGTWRAAIGDYFQSPNPLETVPDWTGIAARSALVRAYTASFQQKGPADSQLRLEAYHKDFERRLPEIDVATGLTGSASTITINSASTGWAEGAELWLGLPQAGPWSAWASYAWSSVMRSAGHGFYDADFSQPHVGNMALQWQSAQGLTLGGRWRIASGIPYTPIASRSYDSNTGRWTPVFGATNSQRLDPYQRVDLRAEQAWPSAWGEWRIFTECFNAFDTPNVTSVTYEDDYSGLKLVRQFPRFFFGGLELQF
jgi:hypothetical protein